MKTFCDKKVFYINAEKFPQLIFFTYCKCNCVIFMEFVATNMENRVNIIIDDTWSHRRLLCLRQLSILEQMSQEFVHLLVEPLEQVLAEYERVVIHNQQVDNVLVIVVH